MTDSLFDLLERRLVHGLVPEISGGNSGNRSTAGGGLQTAFEDLVLANLASQNIDRVSASPTGDVVTLRATNEHKTDALSGGAGAHGFALSDGSQPDLIRAFRNREAVVEQNIRDLEAKLQRAIADANIRAMTREMTAKGAKPRRDPAAAPDDDYTETRPRRGRWRKCRADQKALRIAKPELRERRLVACVKPNKVAAAMYETAVLASPELSEKDVAALSKELSDIVERGNGKVTKSEYYGLRPLAFKVKKHRKAHYALLNIEAPPTVVLEMERCMGISPAVLRYVTVKVERHDHTTVQHAANRTTLQSPTPKDSGLDRIIEVQIIPMGSASTRTSG